MHTKRIIPCLDVKEGHVVKGTNFVELRDAGDPVELAALYDTLPMSWFFLISLRLSSSVSLCWMS